MKPDFGNLTPLWYFCCFSFNKSKVEGLVQRLTLLSLACRSFMIFLAFLILKNYIVSPFCCLEEVILIIITRSSCGFFGAGLSFSSLSPFFQMRDSSARFSNFDDPCFSCPVNWSYSMGQSKTCGSLIRHVG